MDGLIAFLFTISVVLAFLVIGHRYQKYQPPVRRRVQGYQGENPPPGTRFATPQGGSGTAPPAGRLGGRHPSAVDKPDGSCGRILYADPSCQEVIAFVPDSADAEHLLAAVQGGRLLSLPSTCEVTRQRPHCCHLGCDREAAFHIQGPTWGCDDYTHACPDHLDELDTGCVGVFLLMADGKAGPAATIDNGFQGSDFTVGRLVSPEPVGA